MSSTPFFRSSTNSSFNLAQIACVRAVAGGEERAVPMVGLVVLLDEVADVDLVLPEAGLEAPPGRAGRRGVDMEPQAIMDLRPSAAWGRRGRPAPGGRPRLSARSRVTRPQSRKPDAGSR